MRHALGGGWHKSGPLAAGVLAALEDAPARMKIDHGNAKRLASGDAVPFDCYRCLCYACMCEDVNFILL